MLGDWLDPQGGCLGQLGGEYKEWSDEGIGSDRSHSSGSDHSPNSALARRAQHVDPCALHGTNAQESCPACQQWLRAECGNGAGPPAFSAAAEPAANSSMLRRPLLSRVLHDRSAGSWAGAKEATREDPTFRSYQLQRKCDGNSSADVDLTSANQWADKDNEDVLISGQLRYIRGWWHKAAVNWVVRIWRPRSVDGKRDYQLTWHRMNREGGSDMSRMHNIVSLSGAAVEATCDPEQSEMRCFRIFALPGVKEDPVEFAAPSAEELDRWLKGFEIATKHPSPILPLGGRLEITLAEAQVPFMDSLLRRSMTSSDAGVFAVVSFDRSGQGSDAVQYRTVARQQQQALDNKPVQLGRTVEFELPNDDPNKLVTFEIWVCGNKKKSRPVGRVDIPLFCLGRNVSRDFELTMRDPLNPKTVASDLATIVASGIFHQPLKSVLLPVPPQLGRKKNKWEQVGEKSMREQFRELADFSQEFDNFSNRFVHHSTFWKEQSFMFKRIVTWDKPHVTLAALAIITVTIGWLYDYILPLATFMLLCFAMWHHPWVRRPVSRWHAKSLAGWRRGRNLWQAYRLARQHVDSPRPHPASERASLDAAIESQLPPDSLATLAVASPKEGPALPQFKELYENERRWALGKFRAERLRWYYDPPNWCDDQIRPADPPGHLQHGVLYRWTVEVNQLTDNDGWRYSTQFGKGAVWKNMFQPSFSGVRQRKHIGRPVPGGGAAGKQRLSSASVSMDKAAPRPSPRASGRQGGGADDAAAGGRGPQLGLAQTPFHDMFQQTMMRWSIVQLQMEYWIDFYERRKNLFLGVTVHTQSLACLGVGALFIVTCLLSTRWLILLLVYSFFGEGAIQGLNIRKNRNDFIRRLKDMAVEKLLEGTFPPIDARNRVKHFDVHTTLDEVADAGVQLLQLRDWIRDEFFDGRPMVQLRALQRCGTLGNLAFVVTWTSNDGILKTQRPRLWYRSTVKNLLEHVPSDITLFQPLTFQGLGDGSMDVA